MNKAITFIYGNTNTSLNIIGKEHDFYFNYVYHIQRFQISEIYQMTFEVVLIFVFRAANIDHGHWTAPYFDCDGLVKMWKITYASPFFGWDSLRQRIEFKYANFMFIAIVLFNK